MPEDSLTALSGDLLSIAPLIFRLVRRKLTETAALDLELNVTPLQFEILMLLEKERTLYVSEIGERLNIAKAQMTKLIDKLSALNLVERKADKLDRRTINITLTGPALSILKNDKSKVMRAVLQILESLGEEDRDTLAVSLRNLRAILLRA
jgi:DNA-binding MarR family transcriptional regulator